MKRFHLDILRNPLFNSRLEEVWKREMSLAEVGALIGNPSLPVKGLCAIARVCNVSCLMKVANHPNANGEVREVLKSARAYELN